MPGSLAQLDRQSEAEKELLKAVAIAPSGYNLVSIGRLLSKARPAVIDAIAARRRAADLEAWIHRRCCCSWGTMRSTAWLDPEDALEAFDEAMRCSTTDLKRGTGEKLVPLAKVATGRAEAWRRIGDIGQATEFQKQAAQLAPNAQRAWLNLAQLLMSWRGALRMQNVPLKLHAASLPEQLRPGSSPRQKPRKLTQSDGMRRPVVSGRDAVRSQAIDALEAQEIKETGNEEQ